MNEYRVTLRSLYSPGCPGHTNLSARQGHYVVATSAVEAEKLIKKEATKKFGRPIEVDVQLWKENVTAVIVEPHRA